MSTESELKHLRKAKENQKTKSFVVKFSDNDFAVVKEKADQYTNGNVSEWVRYAAKLEPRESDLAE